MSRWLTRDKGWFYNHMQHQQHQSTMAFYYVLLCVCGFHNSNEHTYKQLKLDEEMCNKMPCYVAAMKISSQTQCFLMGQNISCCCAFVKFTRQTSGRSGENGLILLLQ